jgi:hypothetical protein
MPGQQLTVYHSLPFAADNASAHTTILPCSSNSTTHVGMLLPFFPPPAGDYDTYIRTRAELEENQMKKYNWEQEQIAGMKEYIARFGHGSAKLARQAQVRGCGVLRGCAGSACNRG